MNTQRAAKISIAGVMLAIVLALSLACSASNKPTPAAPATPQPAVGPTESAPELVATIGTNASPTTVAQPTPATVLPTATSVATGQPVYGGTLRYVTSFQTSTVDPQFMLADPSTPAAYIIYNQIVRLGTNMDIQPELVESWTVAPDGQSVTFKFRQGIKFQDGTPFNAEAVKSNLDRCLNPNISCVSLGKIDTISSVTVLDDYTLKVSLSKPWRPIMAGLAEIAGFQPSPTAIEKTNSYDNPTGDFGRHPVGTGAYIMTDWQVGSRMTFVKNNDYWETGKPYLDKVIFYAVEEVSTQIAMLRTGDAELAANMSMADLAVVKNDPSLKIDAYPSGRVYHAVLNVGKAPFNNRDLRQAVAYAIDRQAVIDTFYDGYGRPAYTVIGQGWAFDPNLKPMDYNPQKAKQKLADAGYSNGITVKIMCKSDVNSEQLCEIFQAQLQAVNINAQIDTITAADYTPRRLARNYEMYFTYRTPLGDPHLLIGELYTTGGRGNYNDYSNSQVDQLLAQAGGEFDTSKAAALYAQIQTILAEDAPTPYYMYSVEPVLMAKNVMNFVRTPDLDIKMRYLWLAK